MRRYTMGNTIYVKEGATKYVNFYTFTPSGAVDDLTGYNAEVYIERLTTPKTNISKTCTIKDNCVSFKLESEDTKGMRQGRFEIQITDGKDLYILTGMIEVKKSILDYTPNFDNIEIEVAVDGGEL